MIGYLPVITFVSVGLFLNEPVSLFASALSLCLVLMLAISMRSSGFIFGKAQLILFLLVATYIVSAILNSGKFVLDFQGNYGRNFGISTFLMVFLTFSLSTVGSTLSSSNPERAFWVLFFVAISYGFIQLVGLDPLPWSNPSGAIQLTLGNPNFAGALLGILAVLPLSRLIENMQAIRKFIWLSLLLFVGFLCLNTDSLQSFFVAFFSISIYIYLRINRPASSSKRLRNFASKMTFGVFSLMFALIFIPVFDFFERFRGAFFYQASVPQRLDYWRTGIEMFLDHPWFGVGPDGFQKFAGEYRSSDQVLRDTNFYIPDRAHNVFIDHFANGGFFAGIIWILFVIYIFVFIIKLSSINLSDKNRSKLAFMSAIWTGYVFQAIISPDQITLAIVGLFAAGSIVSLAPERNQLVFKGKVLALQKLDPIYLRAVFFSVFVFSSIVWGKAIQSDFEFNKIIDNRILNQEAITRVVKIWPAPKPLEEVAISIAQLEGNNCELIEYLANELYTIDSRSSQALFLKAICANQDRDFLGALAFTEEALRFDPMNQVFLSARVKLAIAIGDKVKGNLYLDELQSKFPENSEVEPLRQSLSLI